MKVAEILENTWVALGFKNKHSFAKSLGERVDTINYAIKYNKLTNSRLEMLIVSKHPVNPEYLKTGEGQILRKVVECAECERKDERIKHLLDEVELLKKYIAKLEGEISALQLKRKVG